MEAHFNFFQYLSPEADVQKSLAAILVAVLLILIGGGALKRLSTAEGVKSAVVPEGRFSLFTIWDVLLEGFLRHQDSIIGKENRGYLPLTGTVFFFVFFVNLFGLIPGMPAATTTVWLNVGMALVVFIAFNYYGMKANGVVGYLKHFCGPVWWMAWLILPIELLSTVLRLLTLNLRLYWNITADHIVLGVFTNLTKLVVPVLFYGLGTFVCFMQAFVFATLTMVYILLATEHEDHGEGHSEAHH